MNSNKAIKVLVVYASSHGQTRKISRWVTDKLVEMDTTVELTDFANAEDVHLDRFDGIILAASVHAGRYQSALSDFILANSQSLNETSTLFISVSLAAAGHEAEDWSGLESLISDLQTATSWTPQNIQQVAGAYLPSKYDIIRRLIMRRILAAKDPTADLDSDREYTDWATLEEGLASWLVKVRSSFGNRLLPKNS